MDDSCAVCAEALEWVAYGACGHREVCSTCVVRLRFVLNDSRCCICKSDCPSVFVTKAMGDYTRVITDFSAFPASGAEGQNGSFWYHEDTQAYFDDADQYRMIRAMCRLSCSVCDRAGPDDPSVGAGPTKRKNRFRSIEQLKGHLFHQHRLFMCNLCLEGRKVFICEQKLYTRSQLNQHIKSGDSEVDGTEIERSGFTGHPLCEFCKSPFYGDNELYMHMSTEHYTCHICQRQHPGQYDYYRNYDDLEMHFRQEHFLCESEDCLAKKFVVFQNEQELKRHNALEHGGHMSRSQRNAALQIPTSFRYRRTEQEHRRGGARGRNFRRDSSGDHYSADPAQQTDSITFSLGSVNLGSRSGPEPVLEHSSFPPLSDLDSNPNPSSDPSDPPEPSASRYVQALGQNARSTASLGEESFPPLPGASNKSNRSTGGGGSSNITNVPQKGLQTLAKNTLASRLRSKGTVKVIPARPRPSESYDPPLPSSSSVRTGENRIAGPTPVLPNSAWGNATSSLSSHNKMKHSVSAPNLGHVLPNSTTSVPVVPVSEDVRNANKSLVERIRAGLGQDEDKYTAFKGISTEYRQGDMNTWEYLSYVDQFGLSHLVLELARLLPDPQKQKELSDAYYVNLRFKNLKEEGKEKEKEKSVNAGTSKKGKGKESGDTIAGNFLETVRKLQSNRKKEEGEVEVLSKDGYRSGASSKGKTVISAGDLHTSTVNLNDEGSSSGKKGNKKSAKFLRVRLGDGSAAALLDLGRNNASPERAKTEGNDNNNNSNNNSNNNNNNNSKMEGGLPVRGVWRNMGGQRLLAKDPTK